MKVRRIEKVLLYNEGVGGRLDIEEIAAYLREKIGKVAVETRGDFFILSPEKRVDFAREFASVKIQDIGTKMVSELDPLYAEIEYEKRRILGMTSAFGVLYDGFRLQKVFSQLLAAEECTLGFVHILFTNRLFATWDEGNKRYHARTSLYGLPSIISTTGLVEAPAKPREYYLLKQQYERLGRNLLEVKDKFKSTFIDYEDERLTEVVKGYAIQAVFYCLTGEPFCEDRGCRLYNAHWQEELIFAQLKSKYEFCERHDRILGSFRAEDVSGEKVSYEGSQKHLKAEKNSSLNNYPLARES